MKHLSIDIETRSGADITKTGSYRYAQDPDFQILLFAYKVDYEDVQIIDFTNGEALPEEIRAALEDQAVIKHAYNAAFEWYCLNRAGFRTPIEQWRCTMFHAMYCAMPAGLAATGTAIGLPEDKKKLSVGRALIKYFCTPQKETKKFHKKYHEPKDDPGRWQLFKTYCKQDVTAEFEILQRLKAFPVPELEEIRWQRDILRNANGVRVDRQLIRGALSISAETAERLSKRAKELTGLDNPNSPAQLKRWITDRTGREITALRKEDVTRMLDGDIPEDVREVLHIRQQAGKTSVKKYDAMRDTIGEGDRIRGLLQFYGAPRTGRWAGRLVQMQNLPRNYLNTLDVARKITRQGNGAGLELIYGNVPDTLAQLIRTAFIPSEGRHFVVTDFSAIEARVIAWLAGEKWVQQVFANGGDIYCATASQMFGVPVEKHGVNGDLRQKGKVATLALGYNGGPGALIQMGALDMGLREDELPDIVRRWRLANPRICKLWRDMEQAAIHTVQTAEDTCVRGITFRLEGDLIYGLTFLTMQLPSGRKLHYQDPVIKEGKFGNPALSYMGQTNHTWVRTDTYGGRLVENCVAKGTQVLTDHGWKSIEQITTLDLVYDGVEFVKHAGVVYQGCKRVNWVNGIYMTPEHKILTSKGWQENGKSNGSYWADISLPYGVKAGRKKQSGKATLVMPVRLRKSHGGSGRRFKEKELCNKIVRVHGEKTDIRSKYKARDVWDTDMERVAFHERTLRSSYGAGVEELRWTGDNCLHKMERKLRKVLCRYGGLISQWFRTGSDRQRQRVQPGKLPLGTEKNKFKEQKDKCVYRYACRKNDNCRSFRNIRDRGHNSVLSSTSRMAERIVIHETKCKKPVYDIKNCGPRHRFIVKDFHEKPRCVHNCIQGIARDCLAEAVDRMEEKGWDIVMMIHDEVVIDAPPEVTLAEANAIMAEPIAWAPGLILKGDGFEGEYYRKE